MSSGNTTLCHKQTQLIAQSAHIFLPLDEFLLLLEKEGFALDTKRRVRLLRALEKHGDRFLDPAEFQNLKYLLAPFVARSEREQAKFYAVFEAFRKECETEWKNWEKRYEEANPGVPKPPVVPPPRSRWKHYRRALLLAFAVVALLLILCKIFCPPPPPPRVALSVENLQMGEDTLRVENRSTGIDSALFRWRVFDAETGREEYKDSTSYHLAWPVTGAGSRKTFELSARHPEAGFLADSFTSVIFCPDPPAAGEIIGPADSLLTGRPYTYRLTGHEPGSRVEWYTPGNDTLRGEQVRITFAGTGDQFVLARVYRPGEEAYCYTDRTLSVSIGADKPYLALLPLYEDEPRTIYRLRTWVWLLLLIPMLAGSWFLRRWWRRRHEKPVQKTTTELEHEYAVLDEGPYHIPYPAQEHKITVPRDFFRIAEVLHRREDSLRRSLDLPASVRATIDNAGFPVLRERPDSLPAAYLFLLERRDPRDQQGLLFARLAAFLRRRDVPAVFFEHDGHFDRFRNDDHPEGLSLTELQRRYPGCRLVLVGNAHHLVQTPADQPPILDSRLLADFARWPRRLLLTPEPPVAWAFQEKLLHTAFLLFPADTDGMLEGLLTLDRTEEYVPGPFDRHRAALRILRNEANPRFNTWQSPADHRLFLNDDPDAYRWLRALAVNAQPDWALTLAVGRAIGVEVTHDRLLRLTRIPWLSANQWDEHLRLAFLRELDPADEKTAREAVVETLREVPDWVKNGFANTERRVNLAVQEFALAPRDETRRQILRELRAVGLLDGSHRAELDQKVQQEIYEKELPPGTSYDLAGVLSVPAPRRFFTRDLIWAICLWGVGLLLFWLALWFRLTPEPPLGSAPMYRAEQPYDHAVVQNNIAVRKYRKIAETKDYLSWYNSRTEAANADTILQQAIENRLPETYSLADSNRFALRYDQAVRHFNFFLDGSAGGITIGRENALQQQVPQPNRNTEEMPIAPMRPLLPEIGAAFAGLAGDSTVAGARRLNALHGQGLCDFYRDDTTAARAVYNSIVAAQPGYFDTLGMRVNLRTLLSVRPSKQEQFDSPRTQRLVLAFRRFYSKKGYVFEQDYPNIIGFRKINNRVRDAWEDFVVVLYKNKEEVWKSGLFRATTMPGESMVRKPMNPMGAAMLAPTQFVGAYTPGEHRPGTSSASPALRQTGLVKVFRDRNQSFDIDPTDPEDAGMFSMNIHGIKRDITPARVGQWSGGDIVFPNKADWEAFQKIYETAYAEQKRPFNLTIVTEKEALDIWKQIAPASQIQPEKELPDKGVLQKDLSASQPDLDMVFVQGGTFVMGCRDEKRDGDCDDNEKPAHEVTVRDFFLGRTEVTNERYAAFLNEYSSNVVRVGEYKGQKMIYEHEWGVQLNKKTNQWAPARGKEKYPVVNVTWYGAAEYARFYGCRLPTEAEWEYAARGGWEGEKDYFTYSGGSNPDDVSWHDGNSKRTTHPVGLKNANQLRLHDMSGNVWEWCNDWYGVYSPGSTTAPLGPLSGSARVVRGGSWGYFNVDVRVSVRASYKPTGRDFIVGFRVAQDAPAKRN